MQGLGGTGPHIRNLGTRWMWKISFAHGCVASGSNWIGSWVESHGRCPCSNEELLPLQGRCPARGLVTVQIKLSRFMNEQLSVYKNPSTQQTCLRRFNACSSSLPSTGLSRGIVCHLFLQPLFFACNTNYSVTLFSPGKKQLILSQPRNVPYPKISEHNTVRSQTTLRGCET
jgi:hypothetical protein